MSGVADPLAAGFSGRCLCGEIRYRVDAAPLWQGVCHCESCRRATSSAVGAFIGVPRERLRWTGFAPKSHASSPDVRRRFCGACGSPISFESDRWPDEIHLYAATLEDPSAYRPTFAVHCAEALSWSDVGGLEPHEGGLDDATG